MSAAAHQWQHLTGVQQLYESFLVVSTGH